MPIIKIHNVETNEVIEREMNSEELTRWEADKAKAESETLAKEEAAAQRQILLSKLGITEEEAKLLLS